MNGRQSVPLSKCIRIGTRKAAPSKISRAIVIILAQLHLRAKFQIEYIAAEYSLNYYSIPDDLETRGRSEQNFQFVIVSE